MRHAALRLALVLMLCFGLGLVPDANALTNGVALTPPMGYNSWYSRGPYISESFVKGLADEMATNGMRAAGYQYINLDDGWAGYRTADGTIVADTNKFPSGMKALADYVHSKGFKFGLYTTMGPVTCAGYPGSYGHEVQDANTYAAWGIDYVKYEGCSLPYTDTIAHAQQHAQRMGNALLNCGRPIFFNLSVQAFEAWMPGCVNSWRGTGDDLEYWDNFLHHLDVDAQTAAFAGPGHWSDPDALMIGHFWSTLIEDKTMFSMACIEAAPLLSQTSGTRDIAVLTNPEAIAVDQDPTGIQGLCVSSNGDFQVWCKPLGGSNSTIMAVALLNRGTNDGVITANWNDLGLPLGAATVRDLWAHVYAGNRTNSYTAIVPPHGVQFVKIVYGATVPLPPAGTNYLSDLPRLSDAEYFSAVQPDQSASSTPITLHGAIYGKGLGTAGSTSLSYFLGGAASRFQCSIGLDDAAGSPGASVDFKIFADGVEIYDSGPMTSQSIIQTIDLDVTGRNELTLVTTANNSVTNAYGDWAGARIIVPAAPIGLAVSYTGPAIGLTWDAPPGAVSYIIKRSTTPGGPYQTIGTSSTPSYSDTTAVAGTTYYYVVSALTSAGETVNSIAISTPVPAYWNNTVTGAPQSWNVNGNWTNTGVFPNQAGAEAVVNASIAANQTINLNQSITLGFLGVGSPNGVGSYTIAANGGALTFDNGAIPATLTQLSSSKGDILACPITLNNDLFINNNSSNQLTISGAVSGSGALTQNGPGPVLLSGSNSFAGGVNIARGTLITGNNSAGGKTTGGIVIAHGATLDLNGFNLGAAPITVSGLGVGGDGAIISSAALPQTNALQFVTLTGDTSFGGTARWDIRGSNNATASGTLSTAGMPYVLTKAGGNQVSIAAVNVDPALADIDIQQGQLSFEAATTSLGNPANTLTVEAGATLAFSQSTNSWNKVIVLNGDGAATTVFNNSGSNILTGPITVNGNCLFGVAAGALKINGPIVGPGSLSKTLGQTLFLYGTNTYAGDTIVAGGTLAIMNSAPIASGNIVIAADALLDVSGHTGGGMTLANGQQLSGNGAVKGDLILGNGATLAPGNSPGTLAFSNSLTLTSGSTCIMGINHSPAASDRLAVSAHLTYGGTLALVNLSTNALVSGDSFTLFNCATSSGAFASITPQTPGPGLLWDTTALSTSGTLRVATGTLPSFNNVKFQGNSIVATGAGGTVFTPNGIYYVLAAPDASLPIVQWTTVATNHFDSTGNFTFTNAINPNIPAIFFRIHLP